MTETTFTLYDKARTYLAGPLEPDESNTLLACGIVNPFGPTLNALVAAGRWEEGSAVPIIQLMLNPFQQFVREVGCVQVGSSLNLATGLRSFFGLPFGDCPTLLMPSFLTNEADTLETYSAFLTSFQRGYAKLESVRKFPGDPWNRVQVDFDKAVRGAIAASREGAPSFADESDSGRPMSLNEARELAAYLLHPTNMKLEMQAFFVAWRGSVELQQNGPMQQQAMSFEDFGGIFMSLAASCVIPRVDD